VAVLFIADNHFVYGVFFAFLGVFFDFFDGFFARKFNVQSDLGLQLDSLADMITSGFVPGLIMFKLLSLSQISWEADTNSFLEPFYNISGSSFLPFLGLAITLALYFFNTFCCSFSCVTIFCNPINYYILHTHIIFKQFNY